MYVCQTWVNCHLWIIIGVCFNLLKEPDGGFNLLPGNSHSVRWALNSCDKLLFGQRAIQWGISSFLAHLANLSLNIFWGEAFLP